MIGRGQEHARPRRIVDGQAAKRDRGANGSGNGRGRSASVDRQVVRSGGLAVNRSGKIHQAVGRGECHV